MKLDKEDLLFVADRYNLLANGERALLEKYCEARARSIRLPGDKMLCRVLGERLLYVDERDLTLTPHLAMSGYWEIWITQAVARFLKPGMHCLDVGANCGYFTILMAELVGHEGRVTAVEPQRRLCDLIGMSAMVNGFAGRVRLHQAALGDTHATVEMYIDPTELGNATVRPEGGTEVRQAPLDSWGIERLDFAKIDAEGSEPRIWAGMQETLKRCRPTVLMEYARGMYLDSPGWLREALDGYRLRHVDAGGAIQDTDFSQIEASEPDRLWMLWIEPPE